MKEVGFASFGFHLLLNAALLLALAQVLDLLLARKGIDWLRRPSWSVGVVVGALAILLIEVSVTLMPGLIFDTRSVLLSLCGLFLGPVPTFVALAIAAAFRASLGGAAVLTGVSVILSSGLLGLAWRRRLGPELAHIGWRPLLGLGITVHVVMLALMLLLPWEFARAALRNITLPVLTLYPLLTVALGLVIAERLQRQRDLVALQAREDVYRSLFSNNHLTMLVIDPATGAIVDANPAAEHYYGWSREQLLRMNIAEINTLSEAEVRQEMARARALEHSHFEFRHRRADGTVRDVRVFSGPVRIGDTIRLYSIVDDESERRSAQRALEDSERKLRLALEAAKQGIFDLNLATGEITVTPGDSTLLGDSPGALRETHAAWIERLHPDDRQRTLALLEGYLAGLTQMYRAEYRRRTPDGSWRWILSQGRVIDRDENGKPIRMLGTHTDVDDRKRAEEALRISEARLARVLEHVPDMVFINRDDRLTYVNPAGVRLLRAESEQQLIGRSVYSLFSPEEHEKIRGRVETMRTRPESSAPVVIEKMVRLDGSVVPVEVNAISYSADGGIEIEVVCRDVSDRLTAEREIHAAEERFSAITEQSIVGIFTVDESLKVSYMNPRGEEIFGYSGQQLEGMLITDLVQPDERDAVAATLLNQFSEEARSHSYEFQGCRKDGSAVLIGAHGTVAEVGGRRVVLGVLQDITDRRRLESTVREYVGRLEGTIFDTADVISELVGLRDPYTAGHQRRVGDLASAIAAEMGKDAEFQRGLRIAGAMHDVGKINVPAEILTKPRALTPIEYKFVKEHAALGYEVLKKVDFPWPVADVAHQHHERIDGSGYPRGLKGDEIILEARIIAVADVVESMASHRPYRPARGLDAALREIELGAGHLYDADVSAACLAVFRERGYSLPPDGSGEFGR